MQHKNASNKYKKQVVIISTMNGNFKERERLFIPLCAYNVKNVLSKTCEALRGAMQM